MVVKRKMFFYYTRCVLHVSIRLGLSTIQINFHNVSFVILRPFSLEVELSNRRFSWENGLVLVCVLLACKAM